MIETETCIPCHGRGTRDGETECNACGGYGVIEREIPEPEIEVDVEAAEILAEAAGIETDEDLDRAIEKVEAASPLGTGQARTLEAELIGGPLDGYTVQSTGAPKLQAPIADPDDPIYGKTTIVTYWRTGPITASPLRYEWRG